VPLAVEDGAISWLVLPRTERDAPRTIRVDGATISEATRCLHELLREPKDLARVVGDVDTFRNRVLAALARLKPSVHHGAGVAVDDLLATLPAGVARRAREVLAEHRALAEMVLFAYALEPAEIRGALNAIAEHGAVLEWLLARDDRVGCFAVIRIAVEDGARGRALLAFAREAFETAVPSCDREAFLERFPVSPAPSASMLTVRAAREAPAGKTKALPKLLAWLGPREPRTRRAALAIVAATAPHGIFRRWAEAHTTLAALDERFRKRKEWASDAPLVSELRSFRERVPPSFDPAGYVDAVGALAETPFVDAFLRSLAVVPEDARARYTAYWAELADWIDEPNRASIADYLDAFREYAARPEDGSLAPWQNLLFAIDRPMRRWQAPDGDLIETIRRKAGFRRFFAALGAMNAKGVSPLDELIDLGMEPRVAAERADAIAALPEAIYPSKRALQLASELEPKNAAEFATIAAALASDGGSLLVKSWTRLGRLDAAALAVLRRTFVTTPHAVSRAGRMLSIARDVPPLVRANARGVPAWARRYPAELHPLLARMSEDVATRVLETDFPSDASLNDQIAALEARGPSSRSRARIATLRGRLGVERTLSKKRLENLARKLERAADRTMWDDWLARLREATAQTIARLLHVERCPPWALEDQNLAAIAGALELEAPHRDLALRMFRVRAGEPPWDLRGAPENVAVLRELRARGIDPSPWVDGIGVLERPGPVEGTRVFLSLEDDPLEIFQMGERFGTCLSIGAANYFSVFANAADIDKRVLYVRDAEGKPLGRCLLALSEDGHVLTFHAYAHQTPEYFADLFAEFARTLAERMGAVCVARGRVRARVAKDWYDDGPRDRAAQFPALENPESLFRTGLTKFPEEEVLVLARAAFAPRPLDGLTIPLVLALDEVKRRPTLALPLLQLLVEQRAPLSRSLRILSADLAHRAGDLERARWFAGNALLAEIEEGFLGDPDHVDERCVEVQLDLDAAALLAMTRRLAPRTRRDDEARLYIGARALERMGRLRRALTIYESLGQNGSHRSDAIMCARKRIEARLARR